MGQKKSFNRITIINILSTVLIQGLTFISAPIFSRLMGSVNYGVYSICVTWVSVFSTVFSLQTGSTIPVAPGVFPEKDQTKYQSSILFLSVSAYVLFSLGMVVFLDSISQVLKLEKPLCILLLLEGFAQMCIAFANQKYTTEFKAGSNLVISLLSTVLGIVVSLLLFQVIHESVNYYARILGIIIANGSIAVVFCINIFKNGRTAYNKAYWKFCLPLALPCIFHLLSGMILNQSDRIMIQQLLGDAQVGIYSLACSFGAIINIIYLALNNSWVPFFFEFARNNEIDQMKSHARNYTELYTVLSIGFVLLAPEVFHLFASEEYWVGCEFIPLFVIAHYFTFLYSFPVNYESFCQNSRIMAITTMVAAIINVVLNYFLILRIGVLGAVIATLVSHIIQFLVHHFSARHLVGKKKYPFTMRSFGGLSLAFLLIASTCYFIGEHFGIVRWGIGIVLGSVELFRIAKRKSIF